MKNLPQVRTNFRHDINGLRAWAVIAVIFYHFGITGFNGGFIGVDVFFVISGFLMTKIIIKGLEQGTFSLVGFYVARGRRIFPALLALCAALLVFGWFILLPPDYKMLSSHSIYALTFLSNVEFWQEAGYFDVASHEKWLLHTWSLSVEWQFYLILPLILWSVWIFKPGRVAQIWVVGFALVASLTASIWTTSTQPSAAFYLLHTRAWEMLGGGMVFLASGHLNLTDRFRRLIELTGLFLILLAIAAFDKDTAWPGWHAALPVGAAMLVLLANRSSPWTNNRVAQWLGDRSYSLYLWHWPLVVTIVYLGWRDNPLAIAAGLLLTTIFGHLSFEWIENTSRRLLERQNLAYAGVALTLAAAVVAFPAVAVWKQQGVLGRFASAVELAAAESNNMNPRRKDCHVTAGLAMPSCVYGGNDWKVISLGDSHSSELITALAKAQTQGDAGVVQWTYSGCSFVPRMKRTPAMQGVLGGKDYRCDEFIAWAQTQLEILPATIPVVIINRYAASAFGANEDNNLVDVPGVYFSKLYKRTTPEFLTEFASHITSSACELAKKRVVYMVRPIPEMGFDVPKTLSRRMAFGATDDLFITMQAYKKRNAWVWAAQDAAHAQCGVKILDPTPYLCRDGKCYGSQKGRPLYSDDDHLSEFGNKLLVPMFAEVYRTL